MDRRAQTGQALLAAMAFMAPLLLAALWVLNAGTVINDKRRLQDAADAAAFSAAVWEARALNYQSYLNRGIVANEVAIAQLVSLRSWSSYLGKTLDNNALVTGWVPYLGEAMLRLAETWRHVDQGLQVTLPPMEVALSQWNTQVLANAQALANQQALVGAAELVLPVARQTEPRAELQAGTRVMQARNALTWQRSMTDRYRRGTELNRFKSLVEDSRDGFSANRRADLLTGVPLVDITKRGGTDMIGQYAWRGMDTLSIHFDLLFGSREVPVGWGAAEQQSRAQATRGLHGGSWRDNPRASRLAQGMLRPRQGYAGLPEIRDVVRPARREDLRAIYSVALKLPASKLETVDSLLAVRSIEDPLGTGHGTSLDTTDEALHAVAAADVHFRRPVQRADGRREWPSLFNPYWQARLVPTDATTRATAAAGMGILSDPYLVLP
ncbi:MAG: hypothetical protein RL026_2230 [Pseudomonadota bacterium]